MATLAMQRERATHRAGQALEGGIMRLSCEGADICSQRTTLSRITIAWALPPRPETLGDSPEQSINAIELWRALCGKLMNQGRSEFSRASRAILDEAR